MTIHVAETDTRLSDLIDRALEGEEIVITRNGKPVARINGVAAAPMAEGKRITQEAIDWLRKNRVEGIVPDEDAGTTVSRMRDEDWAH